jgi:uncharacterized membrane protein
MTWSTRFRIRESVRGSLWLLPLIGAILGALLGLLGQLVDQSVNLPAAWEYSPSTASTVLATIVGATAALTGFVVTVTVLVVQMATGTFSARYMRLWYRDRMLKATLAVLIGTLTFSFALLRRVESDYVPNLGVTVAGGLVVTSLLLFLFFFDRFIHRLRPVAVTALVAHAGRRTFEESMRARAAPDAPEFRFDPYISNEEASLVVRASEAGAIQALDTRGLVRWAREHGSRVVVPHVVGDFVSAGAVLMRVYGGTPDTGSTEQALRGMVALGDERTIQQDTAFAVRIMVDIALMALSPAVNAPTTAVQVLDHLEETLRQIGTTDLEALAGPKVEGVPAAVVMRTRRWEDYLSLGVTEIREYGAVSIQVMRRLRAVLEELHDDVLLQHRPAVEEEIARLDATVAERWTHSVDLDRASTADGQGIGGPGAPSNPAR